jgi:hypothetical protein
MKNGSTHSIVFTPPPSAVREAREADQEKVAADPQEAVLIYSHMRTDIEIIAGELRGLEFSGGEYRSKLRVARSAALRLADRAAKLLGEASS